MTSQNRQIVRPPNIFSQYKSLVAGYPSKKRSVEIAVAKDLVKILRDKRPLNRVDVAELLGQSYGKYGYVAAALSKVLLTDTSWLVRVCAAESIGLKKYYQSAPALRKALNDKHQVVRGYSAEAMARVGSALASKYIVRRLQVEHSSYAKLKMYAALYDLGEKKVFPDIIKMLKNTQKAVRTNTAAILMDRVDKRNAELISSCLVEALRRESEPYIRRIFRGYLKELEDVHCKRDIRIK